MTRISKTFYLLIALLLANFIGGLDTTMLNTALPQIIKGFKWYKSIRSINFHVIIFYSYDNGSLG